MNKWIPVSERLPQHREPVLISCSSIEAPYYVTLGEYDEESGYFEPAAFELLSPGSHPEAWMPLPSPFIPE